MSRHSPWLLCRRQRPDAATRLYCFPHSGGSSGEFLFWSDGLPEFELWGAQPPGRGSRLLEEPLTSVADLVAAVVEEVDFVPPYALFGHSLGAAVVYELAMELRARQRPLPDRLYLSAHEAPHVHHPDPSLAELGDSELLAELDQQFGPVPEELRDDPEWRALVLDALRADLRMVATYRPVPAEPLPCSIVAMGGTEDPVVSQADLAAWGQYTTESFELRMFAGGHFYFREHSDDVVRHFSADLLRPAR